MNIDYIIRTLPAIVMLTGIMSCDQSASKYSRLTQERDSLKTENDISEGDSESSTDRITELIKRNISATVNYDDYGWNISIKSKLGKTFPNKTIIYGVESGYGSYDYYEHFKFGGDLQKSDGRGNMTICYPVFVG